MTLLEKVLIQKWAEEQTAEVQKKAWQSKQVVAVASTK